jgi:uncharacterized protein (TIGR02118 family)
VIKLIAVLRRKPGMTPTEFHDSWRDHHGPLVASTKSGRHALKYEQNHRADAIPDWLGTTDADGVTIQWFESIDDFVASIQEDDYAALAADMEKFLDTSSLVWLLTEDGEIVWDSLRP